MKIKAYIELSISIPSKHTYVYIYIDLIDYYSDVVVYKYISQLKIF